MPVFYLIFINTKGMSIEEQIKEIEDEIFKTKYNKATQHHIGKLKAKIAALKAKAEVRKKSKGKGLGFGLKKEGNATVVLVGLPSVGKSTLLNRLTNANSTIGAYEFTTLDVVPGMLDYQGVKVQLLDLPGLIIGAAGGKGRGKEVMSMVRVGDLALIVLDPKRLHSGVRIKKELEGVGIRLDTKPPDVSVYKSDRGGVVVTRTVRAKKVSDEEIVAILSANSVHNAQVIIREDINIDQMIDAVSSNRIYLPSIVVVNKADIADERALPADYMPISATEGFNIEELKELIFKKLDFCRVYMKPQGGKTDLEEPFILPAGSRIKDLAGKMHKDFVKKFRYAMVWGDSVKHDGQRCGPNHILKDKDIVTIVKELK